MKSRLLFLPLALFILINACDDDDPTPENPEELITTLRMDFVPHGGGETIRFEFSDPDGDGGQPPVITTDTLAAQTEYHATLTLLNEAASPTEDITAEILGEAEAHQFFFPTTGVSMTFEYDDMDGGGNPVGVVSTWMTGDAASGTLTVILRHEPDKNAPGVRDGDVTQAGGETDIEVEFSVNIL